jgi:hypothetical protein
LAHGSISENLQAQKENIVLAMRNVGRRTRGLPYSNDVYVDYFNLPKERVIERCIEIRGTLYAEIMVGQHFAGDIVPKGKPVTRRNIGSL